jgi:O-6-methylguanine DNA methyltransferase
MNHELVELPVMTADGIFLAHYSEKGLARLDFPNANGLVAPKPGRSGRAVASKQIPLQILRWHRITTAALKQVLSGRAAKNLPPLDWTGKTEFQQAVWRAMLKLGPGKTRSYGEMAAAIGRPKAIRAVGGACGANPVPVLVPCHRILAANKKLGGFGGGLDWKRRLLAREGINFAMRAAADCAGKKLPFTFSQMLQERKKR